MFTEKRMSARNNIFLIIHFRLIQNSYEYALGIARDYSESGFSMESHNFNYKQGQILECTLTHPESEASLSIIGEIVWKNDGWYDTVMGIRFLQMDEKKISVLRALSAAGPEKNHPVFSDDLSAGCEDEQDIQNRLFSCVDSEKPADHTEVCDGTPPAPVQTMSSSKTRRPYFLYSVFFTVSIILIFTAATRIGMDSNLWSHHYIQGGIASVFEPGEVSPFTESGPLPGENEIDSESHASQVGTPSHEPVPPAEIIRDEIIFAINSHNVSSQFDTVIERVADILLGNPSLTVKLEGHTDSAGSETYNMDLSLRRASAVQGELIKKGVFPSRIKIVCFGHTNPVASNDFPNGRRINRRVDIIIPGSET